MLLPDAAAAAAAAPPISGSGSSSSAGGSINSSGAGEPPAAAAAAASSSAGAGNRTGGDASLIRCRRSGSLGECSPPSSTDDRAGPASNSRGPEDDARAAGKTPTRPGAIAAAAAAAGSSPSPSPSPSSSAAASASAADSESEELDAAKSHGSSVAPAGGGSPSFVVRPLPPTADCQ
jgi:hypothetical protein